MEVVTCATMATETLPIALVPACHVTQINFRSTLKDRNWRVFILKRFTEKWKKCKFDNPPDMATETLPIALVPAYHVT